MLKFVCYNLNMKLLVVLLMSCSAFNHGWHREGHKVTSFFGRGTRNHVARLVEENEKVRMNKLLRKSDGKPRIKHNQ